MIDEVGYRRSIGCGWILEESCTHPAETVVVGSRKVAVVVVVAVDRMSNDKQRDRVIEERIHHLVRPWEGYSE